MKKFNLFIILIILILACNSGAIASEWKINSPWKKSGSTVSLVNSGSINISLPITTITTTYTAGNDYTILANAASGAFTVTLPAAASNSGVIYNIKKIDSSTNAVTIDGNASETIDGLLTYTLSTQNEEITIQSDGSNWRII